MSMEVNVFEVENLSDLSATYRLWRLRGLVRWDADSALKKNHDLWQPGTGHPFFEKRGLSVAPGILLHRGMSVRAVELERSRIGLCVDMRHRYISASPLPSQMDRRAFQQHKMRHVIYRMGHY